MSTKKVNIRVVQNFLYVSLILAGLFVMVLIPHFNPVYASNFKPPNVIKLSTFEIGSSAYTAYGLIGEFMVKQYGTKLRLVPIASDVGRMTALRAGTVQFIGEGPGGPFAIEGTSPIYSTTAWGPQNYMRVVWMPKHAGQSFVVRGNSNIQTIADLKGKRIAITPGSYFEQLAEAFLGFDGLTLNDVKIISAASYSAGIKMVIDGSADTTIGMVTSPLFGELQASPYGIRWLSKSDPNKYEKIREKVPFYVQSKITNGIGISDKNPIMASTFPYPATLCSENTREEDAYFLTKSIHEGYETFAKASPYMRDCWNLKEFLNFYENVEFAVLHKGTEKYLKEIGKWKPEYDNIQKTRLAYLNKLRKLWDDVIEESADKKMTEKEVPKYWMKRRAEIFSK